MRRVLGLSRQRCLHGGSIRLSSEGFRPREPGADLLSLPSLPTVTTTMTVAQCKERLDEEVRHHPDLDGRMRVLHVLHNKKVIAEFEHEYLMLALQMARCDTIDPLYIIMERDVVKENVGCGAAEDRVTICSTADYHQSYSRDIVLHTLIFSPAETSLSTLPDIVNTLHNISQKRPQYTALQYNCYFFARTCMLAMRMYKAYLSDLPLGGHIDATTFLESAFLGVKVVASRKEILATAQLSLVQMLETKNLKRLKGKSKAHDSEDEGVGSTSAGIVL